MSFNWSKKSEPQQNYLESVSDLMAGLLFVFILIIVFSIHSYNNLTEQLAGNDKALNELLHRIQKELKAKNINVIIYEDKGILRIPEQSLMFDTGKSDLNDQSRQVLRVLRQVMEKEIKCYTYDMKKYDCSRLNPYKHTLDAIFIEGHTDNQPYGGDFTGEKNRKLSTDRANSVYEALLLRQGILRKYKNSNGELLFSLSGYGSTRPVPGHFHSAPTSDPYNRRIELRFIMTSPKVKSRQ